VNADAVKADQVIANYTADEFRARAAAGFSDRRSDMETRGGDGVLNDGFFNEITTREFKDAAVLIPVIDYGDRASVLLTQRTETLSSHKGQIAFPGGKIDPGETREEAALREAEEEVGLTRAQVDVVGTLGPYYSGSGYCIAPVLAIVKEKPELTINEAEVADAFEVPLSFLMDRQNHHIESLRWKEKDRHFFAMPYLDTSVSPSIERRIWGVTAGIIRMVHDRVYAQ